MELPFSIPNKVVKRRSADGTRKGRVGSRQLEELKLPACPVVWRDLHARFKDQSYHRLKKGLNCCRSYIFRGFSCFQAVLSGQLFTIKLIFTIKLTKNMIRFLVTHHTFHDRRKRGERLDFFYQKHFYARSNFIKSYCFFCFFVCVIRTYPNAFLKLCVA